MKAAMHSNRGKAHAVLGRLQYAVADFERAVELGYVKAVRVIEFRGLRVYWRTLLVISATDTRFCAGKEARLTTCHDQSAGGCIAIALATPSN